MWLLCFQQAIVWFANQRKEGMMEFLILLLGFILLDLAALRWGVDSGDGIDSPEWQRRYMWALRMVGTSTSYIGRAASMSTLPLPPLPKNIMLNVF
jgi:hypothetical protein